MQKYTRNYNKKVTPQSEAIPGRETEMAENYAGGVVFKLDEWQALDRFIILGSSLPTYYASAKTLTKENAKNIEGLIKKDAKRVVDRIVEISDSGRAPNNDPALFALAMVAGLADEAGKKYALDNLSKVARIGTHLFHFAEYVQAFRGWGRGLRKGLANWYLEKAVDKLALQVVKYQSRDGWSHRDILRTAHVHPNDNLKNTIFAWATHGVGGETLDREGKTVKTFPQTIEQVQDVPLIYAFELAKKAENEDEVVKLIKQYNLPREAVPTQFMGKKVYEALLPEMGLTALIRNLGNLSKVGILKAGNFDDINFVVDKITNAENLRKSRVHPIQLLIALKTYETGHGMRGRGEWDVIPQIVDALDAGFYAAFANVKPTGKKILIALDVSGSMSSGGVAGVENLSPREGSAAMALVTMKAEQNWTIIGFTGGGWMSPNQNINNVSVLDLTPRMRLGDVVRKTSGLPFGGTDCALPMLWAKAKKLDFDAIFVYTDSETWSGDIHPTEALAQYERAVGHSVKEVVVGMTATSFSIADPTKDNQLDVVGFDSSAPQIMSDFIAGNL